MNDYKNTLDTVHKKRYVKKTVFLIGFDWYEMEELETQRSQNITNYFDLQFPDIYMYLVNQISAYTNKQL